FGGLTILLQNDAFIKWKPTIVNWLFALIVLWTLFFSKKSALEYLLGSQMELPKPVWTKVNIAWVIFFILMGFLNLYVAFYYNLSAPEEVRTDTWVDFKVFGMMGLTLLFTIALMASLYKYIKIEQDEN
ncbi:MAG: septation protein IspZ, partial [Gammaproteobacteria bacterium]|nr:septation protein IspZ [Gammaproteobacteria bacterium]